MTWLYRGSIALKLEVFDNSSYKMNFPNFPPTSSAKCASSSELYYVHGLMILSSMTEQWRQAMRELRTRLGQSLPQPLNRVAHCRRREVGSQQLLGSCTTWLGNSSLHCRREQREG